MRSESLKQAQKRYYEKNKNTIVYQNRLKSYREKNKLRYSTDENYREHRRAVQRLYYKNKKFK